VFHATSLSLAQVSGTLTGSCGDNPGIACRLTWDLSHSTNAAQLVNVYLAGPANRAGRILFIIILALLVRTVLCRLLSRIAERAATATLPVAQSGRVHKAAVAGHSAPGPSARSCAARSRPSCSASRR
jgi:hypothetical protein